MKTLYHSQRSDCEVRLIWCITNWTFGIYAGKLSRSRIYGIDLGPLEFSVKRSRR